MFRGAVKLRVAGSGPCGSVTSSTPAAEGQIRYLLRNHDAKSAPPRLRPAPAAGMMPRKDEASRFRRGISTGNSMIAADRDCIRQAKQTSGRVAGISAVLIASCLAASPAFAHHMMDGEVPRTAMQGLLSGLGHPIIGIDHLAFVVAVGLIAQLTARPLAHTALFAFGTALGCLLMLASPGLPHAELAVFFTLLAGAVLLYARGPRVLAGLPIFLPLAGLAHGYAYGESIVGAEATPLGAYIAGFLAVQFAIAAGAGLLLRAIVSAGYLRESGALRIASGCLAAVAVVAFATSVLTG